MRDRWESLALREKQMVSLGIAFIIFALFYFLFWSPFTTHVDSLREKIQHDRQLLAWMEMANQQIQSLAGKKLHPQNNHPISSLPSLVQTQINHSPIGKNLSELRQADHDSVHLSFKKVEFDKLISWLTQAWQNQNLIVTQISISPLGPPGIVSAEIELSL